MTGHSTKAATDGHCLIVQQNIAVRKGYIWRGLCGKDRFFYLKKLLTPSSFFSVHSMPFVSMPDSGERKQTFSTLFIIHNM